MPDITDYHLVCAAPGSLTKKVSEMIRVGWQPFGSPTVLPPANPQDDPTLLGTAFQAMVKYPGSL